MSDEGIHLWAHIVVFEIKYLYCSDNLSVRPLDKYFLPRKYGNLPKKTNILVSDGNGDHEGGGGRGGGGGGGCFGGGGGGGDDNDIVMMTRKTKMKKKSKLRITDRWISYTKGQ